MSESVNAGREHILEVLERHDVQFVLIGGGASQTRGWDGFTEDVDVTPARDPDNLGRLSAALNELEAKFRVDPDRYPDGYAPPGGIDPATFTGQVSVAMTTPHGHLDVALLPDGLDDGYGTLIERADRMTVALTSRSATVAHPQHIIWSKEAAARPKDYDVLPELHQQFTQAGYELAPLSDATLQRTRGDAEPAREPEREQPRRPVPSDPQRRMLLARLHGIDYLVVGDTALHAHGQLDQSAGFDLTPAPGPANLQRLADALTTISPDTTQAPDAATLADAAVTTIDTNLGRLTIHLQPSGFRGGYDDLAVNAREQTIPGTPATAPVAALHDVQLSRTLAQRAGNLDREFPSLEHEPLKGPSLDI